MTATINTTPDPVVVAAVNGDREAFGQLWAAHHDAVFRMVNYLVRDRHLAEDLTSETFAGALAGIGTFRNDGTTVRQWLYSIARYRVTDHFRRAHHRLASSSPVPDRVARNNPEREVIARDAAISALRCIAGLREEYRVALVCRLLDGLSRAETAEVMGRTEQSVRALQWRASGEVRRTLDRVHGYRTA